MAVFMLSGSLDFCFDSFIIWIKSGDKVDQSVCRAQYGIHQDLVLYY